MERDNVSKVEINVHDGGQINFVKDNGSINAVQNNTNEEVVNRPKIKSRTQEYASKWNENMFLNDFDKRDEEAGVNIKLKEVYSDEQLPHYLWKGNKNVSNDIKDLLSEYIEKSERNKPTSLLILGHPGMGKSTLITWIIANFSCCINDILVYQFASDLKYIDWNCTTKDYMYWDEILNVLGLTYDDLHGKVLIFDGFDEINVKINQIDILNKLMSNEIKRLSADFSLIVTCRENYIHGINKITHKYITLQPWNSEQIKGFCKLYSEKSKYNISKDTMVNILNNMEIFGIPLILYMVLALNISIEKAGSIVDVYDKVFSLDGGIYDRCIDYRSFAEPHRIGEVKQQIHQISREIAVWMFKNNQVEAYIPQNEYQKICNSILEKNQGKEDIKKDFLIGNYFNLVKHYEGVETEKLYFVHRSIYEYFVAEFIYISIENVTTKENMAEILGNLLKDNILPKQICIYLKHKIMKSKLKKFCLIKDTFQIMLQNGMTYYTNKCLKNVMECELTIFANMLEIIHFWEFDNINFKYINKYIMYNDNLRLNLSRIDIGLVDSFLLNYERVNLQEADLRGSNLSLVNLRHANLYGADLRGVSLECTNLMYANLTEANLSELNLCNATLDGAIISSSSKYNYKNTIFSEEQALSLETWSNFSESKVYIKENQTVINYLEFCKQKGKNPYPIRERFE